MCEELKQKLLSRSVECDSGCWIWTGAWANGYGQLYYNGIQQYTHIVSYKLFKGEVPRGLFVLHTCDTASCWNPEHLFLGTQQDNMTDKVNKNRQAKGVDNGTSKLSESEVLEIRRLLEEGNLLQCTIANKFNVDPKTITNIKHRRQWRHI